MKISYKRGLKLIEKNNQKLVYKIKKSNKDNLYNYLRIKDFDNFLLPLEVTQEYEVYKYIDEKNIPAEDKAVELVNLLSLLHTKTTAFQEVNQEKVDELQAENIEEQLKKDIARETRELPSYKHVTEVEIRKTEFLKTTTNKIKR